MDNSESIGSSPEWHYTAGDGQAGPVTFEELRTKAASGELHPRNDMAWCNGMDEWKPAGEIDGLFDRKTTEESPAGKAAKPASLDDKIKELSDGPKQPFAEVDLFPGATRRWYLFMVYVFPFLWIAIAIVFAKFVGGSLAPSFQKLFLLIGIIVPTWAIIETSLTRLTNLGMSKLWFLGYFIPVVNLWVGYRVFACPSGYAKTKKMDGPGWVLAIVYWLLIVGSVASAVLIPATMAEMMKTPEFREKFDDFKKELEKVRDSTKKPDEDKSQEDSGEEPDEKPVEPRPAP